LGDNFICNKKTPDTTYVEALVQEDIIDKNNSWSKSKSYLWYYSYSEFPSENGPIISNTISGSWFNQHNIFIGVKIIKDGKELFGWIDVDNPSPLGHTTVVRRYAISQPY
jgi:hypothetical protein